MAMERLGLTIARRLMSLWRRDKYTSKHSRSVASLATRIGRELGFSDEDLRDLEIGGLLHDIGKLAVPGFVLYKQHVLNPDERSLLVAHPETGAWLASLAGIKSEVVLAIRHHHERLNGSGYPSGLVGYELSFLAQIISVADVYSAMTHDRPYRSALSHAEALTHLRDSDLFNQTIVDALMRSFPPGEQLILDPSA
jgi:putative nucleotidyltransferase with HDIG domain